MKLDKYLKDKAFVITVLTINYFLLVLIFYSFKISIYLIILFSILFIGMSLIIVFFDYFRKRKFYDSFINNLAKLDKKFLILETEKMPNFYDGQLLYQTLYEANKSMIEYVNTYSDSIDDFKDYIEMWIHEVKIPISSLVLLCHNNKDILDKKYIAQVRRLDNYIDQVLYYVRSNYTEADFIFRETKLEKIIGDIALKNKDDLLENDIDFDVDLKGLSVYTDSKWLEFIINQVINNSIKYKDSSRQSFIKIYVSDDDNYIILSIEDNGIGIPKGDLGRIFNKSFTGENGRVGSKSTGMGLYIAKKLCNRLGHKIEAESIQGEGTTIKIFIGKHEFYKFNN